MIQFQISAQKTTFLRSTKWSLVLLNALQEKCAKFYCNAIWHHLRNFRIIVFQATMSIGVVVVCMCGVSNMFVNTRIMRSNLIQIFNYFSFYSSSIILRNNVIYYYDYYYYIIKDFSTFFVFFFKIHVCAQILSASLAIIIYSIVPLMVFIDQAAHTLISIY